jgi:glycosyltransferase involved in cell wall biosynthesis
MKSLLSKARPAGAGSASSPPRVLLTEWRLGDDGAARSSLRLVSRWRAAGADVDLFAVSVAAPLPAGVEPIYPGGRARRLRHAVVPGVFRLLNCARRSDVVVSGRELGFGLLAAWLAARLARRPFVVMVRSDPLAAVEDYVPARWQGANRRALRRADAVICISDGLAPAAEAAGVPHGAVKAVLNGVEVDRVVAAGGRPARPLPSGDGPLLVGVGRLERQKGFDLLIRAHARVLAEGHAHRLLLLGEGRDREELERLVDALGVGDSVDLPGFERDPLPVIAAADLFCLPSRWEGFGQSLAEALLLGTPVVAADCVSGPRQLLADGAHGDLVPVEDIDALARAIARHIEAPDRLRRAAQRGRDWGHIHLDVDRTAAEMLDVLDDVRRSPRRRRGPWGDGA